MGGQAGAVRPYALSTHPPLNGFVQDHRARGCRLGLPRPRGEDGTLRQNKDRGCAQGDQQAVCKLAGLPPLTECLNVAMLVGGAAKPKVKSKKQVPGMTLIFVAKLSRPGAPHRYGGSAKLS